MAEISRFNLSSQLFLDGIGRFSFNIDSNLSLTIWQKARRAQTLLWLDLIRCLPEASLAFYATMVGARFWIKIQSLETIIQKVPCELLLSCFSLVLYLFEICYLCIGYEHN